MATVASWGDDISVDVVHKDPQIAKYGCSAPPGGFDVSSQPAFQYHSDLSFAAGTREETARIAGDGPGFVVIQHEKGTTPSTQGEGAVEAADNEPGEDPFRDNEEVERLPKMMDSIRFDVRSVKATPRTDLEEASACAASNEENAKLLEPMSEVVADGFVRSDACQPSPWAMRLQPGVVLEWRGRKKTGPCGPTAGVWKVYKGHTEEPRVDENETSRGTALDGRSRENDQEATDSPERVPELRGAWRQGLPPRPASAHAILGCRSDSSIAASLVSKTPATALNTAFGWLEQGKSGGAPSKVQGRICAPPPQRERPSSALPRRSESCTGALGPGPQGVLRSQPRQPRQKVPLLGGTGAIVQPPLGATMGHGLLPAERNLREAVKKGEFYYPATSQVKVDQVRVTRAGSASLSRTRSAHALERGTSTRGTSTRAAWR
ncbi:Putative HNH endonuclease [Durusdinium trenchii]|uniref:HNH endonuclease n=1 Tax=Durusdinium trenchii TaxID=1381693 RepID=A0ABP0QZD2_9DINO